MEWSQGHNPDLVITNANGAEKERIDLTEYTFEELHELMRSKGFARKKDTGGARGRIQSCSG